jgi:hypothetical protein
LNLIEKANLRRCWIWGTKGEWGNAGLETGISAREHALGRRGVQAGCAIRKV